MSAITNGNPLAYPQFSGLRRPARARLDFHPIDARARPRAVVTSLEPAPGEMETTDSNERIPDLLRLGGCLIALAAVIKTSGALVQCCSFVFLLLHYLKT